MNGFRRLSLAAVLILAGAAAGHGRAAASPVVDDDRLARDFVAGLGRLVDAAAGGPEEPLGSEAAAEQLAAVEGRRVRVPAEATPCALAPNHSLYETVMPAVVVIGSVYKCGKCNDWHMGGLASGWLLSADGLVVTNHHVFGREANHRFGVMTADGAVYAVGEVLAADEAGDAAVVRIDTRGKRLPCLALGQAADCGDEVTVISHPVGRFYCLTEGVVSRFHRQRQPPANADAGQPDASKSDGERNAVGQRQADRRPAGRPAVWMSVTADYAVGSSGGPVFNGAGEVVGMVSRTFSSRSSERRGRGPGMPGDQMVFKDCVSLDTLRRLVTADPS